MTGEDKPYYYRTKGDVRLGDEPAGGRRHAGAETERALKSWSVAFAGRRRGPVSPRPASAWSGRGNESLARELAMELAMEKDPEGRM
jgi:hypothetical protein